MGCDIHLHIEIKVNYKWEHYASPNVKRWYELFEKMAGARGNVKNAIVKPKGLPVGLISTTTRLHYDYWEHDAHHVSWFNFEEIEKLNDWLELKQEIDNKPWPGYDLEFSILNHTYFFGNSFLSFKENPRGCQDIRFIFWFDS